MAKAKAKAPAKPAATKTGLAIDERREYADKALYDARELWRQEFLQYPSDEIAYCLHTILMEIAAPLTLKSQANAALIDELEADVKDADAIAQEARESCQAMENRLDEMRLERDKADDRAEAIAYETDKLAREIHALKAEIARLKGA